MTTTVATTHDLRRLIEVRRVVKHWGRRNFVTPKLVEEVFGDGARLIGLSPTMYRPHYFVVRIDSGWNLSNHARDCELLIDHLDEVYDAIEDEFPYWPWWRKYGLLRSRERGEDCSARTDFGDGSCWWVEDWPKKK